VRFPTKIWYEFLFTVGMLDVTISQSRPVGLEGSRYAVLCSPFISILDMASLSIEQYGVAVTL